MRGSGLSAAVRSTSLKASTAGAAWYSRTCVAPSNSLAWTKNSLEFGTALKSSTDSLKLPFW